MKIIISIVLLVLLSGCATTRGLGEDITNLANYAQGEDTSWRCARLRGHCDEE